MLEKGLLKLLLQTGINEAQMLRPKGQKKKKKQHLTHFRICLLAAIWILVSEVSANQNKYLSCISVWYCSLSGG